MSENQNLKKSRGWSRRDVLKMAGALAAGGSLASAAMWFKRHERGKRADVFIGKATAYDTQLVDRIAEGFVEIGITRQVIRGKRVLLKPNLVETAIGHEQINTHPAMVVAAAEVFRRLDARDVIVAEGQGHRRDSWLVLEESGMERALLEANLPFFDLNHDDVSPVANAGPFTSLKEMYLPRVLRTADFVVSMPKLKTHHWVGVTCAMKNLFGVMPGIVYGWPKNVLHYQGIDQCILDINATVQPDLAIVDGIVGMEGDGPIMGTAKAVGALVIGRNLPAVDATCVRLMQLNPYGIKYLAHASGRLGPIHAHNITQRGERIDTLATPFDVLDLPHLQDVRS